MEEHTGATVSGFPLSLTGWNANFATLTRPASNWCYRRDGDRYVLDPYTLYGVIPILGAEIKKDRKGVWRLYPDDGGCGYLEGYHLVTNGFARPITCGTCIHFDVIAD